MASASTSAPPPPLHLQQRLDLDGVRTLVALVHHHLHQLLVCPAARKTLQLKCRSLLAASTQSNFEFSEQSVLSNLYWGIEKMEMATESDCQQEKAARLASSEKMLQIPALLSEEGSTAGSENRLIVCYAYFYLALVQKLHGNERQMTIHLLQSLLVSPECFRELAPGMCESFFCGSMSSGGARGGNQREVEDEMLRLQARRYKDCLVYYQVISYGEASPWMSYSDKSHYQNSAAENYHCIDNVSIERLNSQGNLIALPNLEDAKEIIEIESDESSMSYSDEQKNPLELKYIDQIADEKTPESIKDEFDMKCLQDMLEEYQTDSPAYYYSQLSSSEESPLEVKMQNGKSHENSRSNASCLNSQIYQRYCLAQCLPTVLVDTTVSSPCQAYPAQMKVREEDRNYQSPRRSLSELSNLHHPVLGIRKMGSQPSCNNYMTYETFRGRSPSHNLRCFTKFSSKLRKKYILSDFVPRTSLSRSRKNYSRSRRESNEESSTSAKDRGIKLLRRSESINSTEFCSEYTGMCKDVDTEETTIWELLKKNNEVKCSSEKREILDQLLDIIAASKIEKVIRASISIVLLLIAEDKTIIQDIKKKHLHLHDFASAVKRNVHEAVTLIYLLNPSPLEIKSLELLPTLVEVACSPNKQNKESKLLPLTPTSASIAMIEVLVTAFDYVTNNMHLATISCPQVLSKLVNAMNKDPEEGVALTAIFIRCMRLNGNCKKFLSQATPVDPFLHLLRSNEKHAKAAALEYFHEILQIPRSSSINLLHQIWQQGGIGIMHSLLSYMKENENEHRLLAANLLLQLDILILMDEKSDIVETKHLREASQGKSVFKEEAIEALMGSVTNEENPKMQTLAASILARAGGTHTWKGEPYTIPLLLKRSGLDLGYHKNLIKNIDWIDPCLQDFEVNAWSTKTARSIIKKGTCVFDALAKGMRSNIRSVSRDCLTCITWLGNEMAVTGPSNLRFSACEILLSEVARFLHPGSEFDERILSCLSVYNYTSGKGKQKLMNLSEGLRESLRRLSGITWMAEELLKVTDYFLPTMPRVSCVHTQVLDVGPVETTAVTALIFYKGLLFSGHSNGSIKVWEIKGQRVLLVSTAKEHKRAITCLTHSEARDVFLSGSSDKTVRVWKKVEGKLECIELMEIREPVRTLGTYGDKTFIVTHSRGLKVWQGSRRIHVMCKNKHIKSLAAIHEKIYLGCKDSSIQEVDITGSNTMEIRAAARSWRLRNRAINSIKMYKGCVYSAGSVVEGSSIKNLRMRRQPEISMAMPGRTIVESMEVVEDFIYLQCSSSSNAIQIWLRGKQRKVGRLSAGSKITSLLAANDFIFCGTESGWIKAWIPL